MSGAKAILEVISSCITTIDVSKQLLDTIRNGACVPGELQEVKARLPLIIQTLRNAQVCFGISSNQDQTAATPLLQSCTKDARMLQEILQKVVINEEDGLRDRYIEYTKALDEGCTVEVLTKTILERLQYLQTNHIFALCQLPSVESSVAEEHSDFSNSGSGSQNIARARSTQINQNNNGTFSSEGPMNIFTGVYDGQSLPLTVEQKCLQSLAFRHHCGRQNLGKGLNGTCGWIFTHEQHLEWAKNGGSLLVSGKPGAGKSTLLKSMFDAASAQDDKTTVAASFFFHGQGGILQHSPLGLFRSLLHQILAKDESLLAKFAMDTSFEKRCQNEGEPGADRTWDWEDAEIQRCLTESLRKFTQNHRLWLYIDGLDESGEKCARHIWNYLREQIDQSGGRLNVCISCRPYPVIVSSPNYSITVEHGNQKDIATYLESAFEVEEGWRSRADREKIQHTLTTRADGMFQWIVCVIDDILGLLLYEESDVVIANIEKTPKKLNDLYAYMLQTVTSKSKEDRLQALHILRWVTFAHRPLSLEELWDATATRLHAPWTTIRHCEKSNFGCESKKSMSVKIETICHGLVRVIDDGDDHVTVEFCHGSVKEYMSEAGIGFLEDEIMHCQNSGNIKGRAHSLLCSILIQHLGTEETGCMPASERHDDSALLGYAQNHWMVHAKIADDSGVSLAKMVDLTQWPSNKIWTQWQKLHERHERSDRTTLQHVAARYGLGSIFTVLSARCRNRHFMRVKQRFHSLRWYADDLDVRDSNGRTPLSWAAGGGHSGVVRALLATKKIEKPDAKDTHGRTPLWYAVREGHFGVVEVLLATEKVDPDAKDNSGETPLLWAAKGGHESIVKALLATKKTDPGAKDKDGRTPLWWAARDGHEGIVGCLVAEKGNNGNVGDVDGRTPLWWAERCGHEGIVRTLLVAQRDNARRLT